MRTRVVPLIGSIGRVMLGKEGSQFLEPFLRILGFFERMAFILENQFNRLHGGVARRARKFAELRPGHAIVLLERAGVPMNDKAQNAPKTRKLTMRPPSNFTARHIIRRKFTGKNKRVKFGLPRLIRYPKGARRTIFGRVAPN